MINKGSLVRFPDIPSMREEVRNKIGMVLRYTPDSYLAIVEVNGRSFSHDHKQYPLEILYESD